MEFLVWIGFCVGIGFFANARGRNAFGWGFLSIFVSPLVTGVILAIMKDLKVEDNLGSVHKKIDNTISEVKYNERLNDYKHTQIEKQLDQIQKQTSNLHLIGTPNQNVASNMISHIGTQKTSKCESCGNDVNEGVKFCPHCGNKIKEKTYCKGCNKEIDENIKFCPDCGEKNTNTIVCKGCGTESDRNTKFCPNCGVELNNENKNIQREKEPDLKGFNKDGFNKEGFHKLTKTKYDENGYDILGNDTEVTYCKRCGRRNRFDIDENKCGQCGEILIY